jgi:cytochrome c-type biogenesis protein CcmH
VLLWVILACLTAIVLLVLLRPLAAAGRQDRAPEAFDAAVYRDQLGEIESDRARGLIGETEAEAARIEIARRLLQADSKERASDGAKPGGSPARAAMICVGAALPFLALGLYLVYGSPRLPDQPLAVRLQDPASDQNIEALVARVEARLRERPEEGEGWEVIAPVYMGWRRYTDAAEAYAQAIRLLGESPKRLSGQGQALVLANNGVVTEEARRALERAVQLDASLVEPRVLIAIAKEQDGQFAAAIEDWRALLAKEKGDAPWREMVEKRIAADEARLAGKPIAGGPVAGGPAAEAGKPAPAGPGPSSQGGPSAAEIAAAQSMSPADRQAMIARMVQGLAAKLEQQGDDLGGWLKLVRAYSVLDRKDDAMKALARAKSQFSGKPEAIEQLDALAAELGLKS